MKTQMIHTRINSELKDKAHKIFNALGLSPAEAVRLFYSQVIRTRGLPFEMRIPNEETKMSIAQAEAGNLTPISLQELKDICDA
jgi:DNA-damage-inducible protein J